MIAKRAPDAFTNPELATLLARLQARRLVVVGVFADACVSATVRSALSRGMAVNIPADAVAAGSRAARDRALRALAVRGARILPRA